MFKQYIDGKLVDGLGKPKNVLNPATGEVAGVVGCATAGQATQALEAAAKAFKTWSKTPVSERIAWILKLRDAVEAEKETFVELVSQETGRTYAEACGDVNWFLISCGFYSDEVKRVYGTSFANFNGVPGSAYHIVERQAIGVIVAHLAWNYPMGNAGIKLCPAIVSG